MIYYNINMLYKIKILQIFLTISSIHHKSLEIQNFQQIKNKKIRHLRNFVQNIHTDTLPIYFPILEIKRKNFLQLMQKEMLYSYNIKSIYQKIIINIIESEQIIKKIQLIYESVFFKNSTEYVYTQINESIFLKDSIKYIYTQIIKMQNQFIILKQEQKNKDVQELCCGLITLLNLALYIIAIIEIKELSFTECMNYMNRFLYILDNNTDETLLFMMFNICYIGANLIFHPMRNNINAQ